jgi:hypothetical protein
VHAANGPGPSQPMIAAAASMCTGTVPTREAYEPERTVPAPDPGGGSRRRPPADSAPGSCRCDGGAGLLEAPEQLEKLLILVRENRSKIEQHTVVIDARNHWRRQSPQPLGQQVGARTVFFNRDQPCR